MPLWRCPHCATPQPESARCWLCGRSTTSCAACRHYRRGMAGGLGMCGLQPKRLALRGTEVLPCWEPVPAAVETPSVRDGAGTGPRGRLEPAGVHQPRTFVPVDELRAAREAAAGATGPGTAPAASKVVPTRSWSLWGDPEG